jgi:threonine/homoserine/homoserine lactone efflux protein
MNFYPFIIYALVTIFTPGPNNIVSMAEGMRNPYPKVLRFLFGIVTGFFIIMSVCGLLNLVLASLVPSSERWLKILGALYMLYLAVHIMRSGPMQQDDGEKKLPSFWFGFSMQFLNVKVILFGVTVFSLFITPVYKELGTILLFAAILSTVAFTATSCWVIGGNLFQNLARKYYRVFNILMGGLLIYTAIASLI